jgi:hypothetical protein
MSTSEILHQGGLADACLAAYQNNTPLTSYGLIQRYIKLMQKQIAFQQFHHHLTPNLLNKV